MAICFFTARCIDGAGDVVQTVKIADFVQKLPESSSQEIIIVVPEDNHDGEHKTIAQRFVNDINPTIQVKTIKEFKEKPPAIDCCIQAGYIHWGGMSFPWQKEIGELISDKRPPFIFMPEYSSVDGMNKKEPLQINAGFKKGELGVIPSQTLLDATAEEEPSSEIIQKSFDTLDEKIRSYFAKNSESYLDYRNTHEFTYQYSHDKNIWEENTPAEWFLIEHSLFVSDSKKSQDILCLGEKFESKIDALKGIKDTLIQAGYTKIVFVNIDTKEEILLHNNLENMESKTYRVLYSKSVPFSTMQVLPLLANDFVGATGDNSFAEAMSAKKIISYETMRHKTSFVEGYIEAVRKKAQNDDVTQLAEYLMHHRHYDKIHIKNLLKNKELIHKLKNINRTLIAESQYFEQIKSILSISPGKHQTSLCY